jgi:hypothetical protein
MFYKALKSPTNIILSMFWAQLKKNKKKSNCPQKSHRTSVFIIIWLFTLNEDGFNVKTELLHIGSVIVTYRVVVTYRVDFVTYRVANFFRSVSDLYVSPTLYVTKSTLYVTTTLYVTITDPICNNSLFTLKPTSLRVNNQIIINTDVLCDFWGQFGNFIFYF